MNGNLSDAPQPRIEDPAWVKWWRTQRTAIPVQHVETKGKRKRTRRERRQK